MIALATSLALSVAVAAGAAPPQADPQAGHHPAATAAKPPTASDGCRGMAGKMTGGQGAGRMAMQGMGQNGGKGPMGGGGKAMPGGMMGKSGMDCMDHAQADAAPGPDGARAKPPAK